jgi:hypothetical protein
MNYFSTLPRFQSRPKALSAYFHPLSDNVLGQALGPAMAKEYKEFIGLEDSATCVDLGTLQPYDAVTDDTALFIQSSEFAARKS